jgi:hypothetical protein
MRYQAKLQARRMGSIGAFSEEYVNFIALDHEDMKALHQHAIRAANAAGLEVIAVMLVRPTPDMRDIGQISDDVVKELQNKYGASFRGQWNVIACEIRRDLFYVLVQCGPIVVKNAGPTTMEVDMLESALFYVYGTSEWIEESMYYHGIREQYRPWFNAQLQSMAGMSDKADDEGELYPLDLIEYRPGDSRKR